MTSDLAEALALLRLVAKSGISCTAIVDGAQVTDDWLMAFWTRHRILLAKHEGVAEAEESDA